jgi:hypothetical protein
MNFIFPYLGNVIIPTDFHIFQRGSFTTNQHGILVHSLSPQVKREKPAQQLPQFDRIV